MKSIPNIKIVRLLRYFHISLAICLLVSTLILNGCSHNADDTDLNWQKASTVPKTLLKLAVNENTSLPTTAVDLMKVATIPVKEKGTQLYIFNYKTPDLCGSLGCLYTGYLAQGPLQYNQVISLYLRPNLPSNIEAIAINPEKYANSSHLPCVDFQQINSNRTLQRLTYCFDGSNYELANNTLLKLPTK